MRSPDRIDHAILLALAKNARLSNKELAAMVGLAPSSCLERTKRLVAEGTIKGFHAEIDPRALGYGIEAMVAIRLKQHAREQVESFRAHARSLPEVVAVYHMAGANDFLLHLVARDAQHLRDLAVDAFTTRPEVAHIETALVFEHLRGRSEFGI